MASNSFEELNSSSDLNIGDLKIITIYHLDNVIKKKISPDRPTFPFGPNRTMTTNTYLTIIITKFTESYKKGNEIYNIDYNGKSDTPYRNDYDVFFVLLGVTIKAKIRIKKFVKVDENGKIIGTNPITDFKNVEFLLFNTKEWVNAETGEPLYSPTDKIKGNKEKFLNNIRTIKKSKNKFVDVMNELEYLPPMSNLSTPNDTPYRFPGGIKYQEAEEAFKPSGGRRKTQHKRRSINKTKSKRRKH